MSASAGNCLGQNDFEEGVGLPWHTCVTNPAQQEFNIDGGTYNVKIVNPGGEKEGGESRWDCQFRHRSLHIEAGHTYKISFDVWASNDGELASQITSLDGEKQIAWINNHEGKKAWDFGPWNPNCGNCANGHANSGGNLVIKKGDNHFESEFKGTETIEVAEWAFHYGGEGPNQSNDCFPRDTELKFDNMTLECTTCGSTYKDKKSTPCLWDPTNEMGKVTPRSDVRINQVGYMPNMVKKATYATDEKISPVKFEVREKGSDKVVLSGTTTDGGFDEDSGEYVQIIDLTDVVNDGLYYIWVDDTNNTFNNTVTGETYKMYISHDFQIGTDIYEKAVTDALNYYYQNRSGMDIEAEYITSCSDQEGESIEKLAHKGGHAPNDDAYVQSEWLKSYAGEFDGDMTYQIDGVGGWYDAGDHGKYVVNGGISVWTLQNLYERTAVMDKKNKNTNAEKFNDGKVMKIPQSYSVGKVQFDGTGSPDILDEARVELEWMFNMIVDAKDPYWGKDYAGFVYHKLHDHKWTGLATRPWDYATEWGTTRIVKPPSYAATLNMIACAAQASRLWAPYDKAFSDRCLEIAENSYEAIMKYESKWSVKSGQAKDADHPDGDPMFAPLDQAIGGGAYGDTYVKDDAYWAACELYATTGDSKYYDYLKKYKNENDNSGKDAAFSLTTNLGGGENNGSFSSFNWGCTAGLGTLSLYLSDNTSAADKATIEKNITAAADTYIAQMASSGMGIPYKPATFTDGVNIGKDENGKLIEVTGYEWGSNSFVVNNAMVMAYAYDINKTNKYISGVTEAMDYIFGRNGNGFSYVTGYGTYHEQRPHHRFWSYELDKEFPMAPSGVMSGGPGAGLQDPYVGGLGYKRGEVPSQKCFVDSIEAWSVNEVTINWNAPFAWVVSFLDDEAADAPKVDDIDPPKPDDILWGDANCDEKVDLADAVLIMQSIANPDAYGVNGSDPTHITEQGILNADVYENGTSGITAEDALQIQKFRCMLITSLDPKDFVKE